jgi:histone deacetylase 1/2
MVSSNSSSGSGGSGTATSLASVLSHNISIKLDDKNFLSWKQQIEGVIRSHKLQSFIVNPKIPDQFLSDEDRESGSVNPEYSSWEQQDSALFTWLLSSLSDSLLPTVVNCVHSYQVWNEINDFHSAQMQAQSTQLRSELKSLVKGSLTTSEYLRKIKSIVNTLISIGDPVSFRDHLDLIFDGLPEEFSPLMALVFNRGIPCSINDVESMIVSHEARLDRVKKKQSGDSLISVNVAQATVNPVNTSSVNATALVTQSMPQPPSGSMPSYSQQSFDPNSAQTCGQGYNVSYSSPDQFYNIGGRNGGRPGRGRGRGGRSGVQCGICHKTGHDASVCYHRNTAGGLSGPTGNFGFSPLGAMQNLAQQFASMGLGGFSGFSTPFPRAPSHPHNLGFLSLSCLGSSMALSSFLHSLSSFFLKVVMISSMALMLNNLATLLYVLLILPVLIKS